MSIHGLVQPAAWSCHAAERRDAPNGWTYAWNYSSTCNTTFPLVDGAELVLTTAVAFAGDCVACGPPTTAASEHVTASESSGQAEVVGSAVALVSGRGADTPSRLSEHRSWWSEYWAAGAAVDLGANPSTLEGFYYGMQYQLGSGTRPGHTAPGLYLLRQYVTSKDQISSNTPVLGLISDAFIGRSRYGPWQTTEVQGFQGDYTTDYNFQAPLYGTFSDNRPELALPHFTVVENHLPLGRWRASLAYWGDAPGLWAGPGFWTQMFGPQYQLTNDTNGLPPWGSKPPPPGRENGLFFAVFPMNQGQFSDCHREN